MEVDEQTSALAAAFAHEATFHAVEVTAYDAYVLTVELGGDLIVAVVLDEVYVLDCIYELLHGLVWYAHDVARTGSSYVAVLQKVDAAYDGVELVFCLVYEDEVVHVGDKTYDALASLDVDALSEGYEHTVFHTWHLLQLSVCGIFGVRACEVAQYVPGGFHCRGSVFG